MTTTLIETQTDSRFPGWYLDVLETDQPGFFDAAGHGMLIYLDLPRVSYAVRARPPKGKIGFYVTGQTTEAALATALGELRVRERGY